MATAATALVVRTATAVARNAAASSRAHPVQAAPGAPFQEAEADVGGHAGQGRERNPCDHARAEAHQDEQEHGVQASSRAACVPPQRTLARLRRDADAHRCPEDARAEVGDSVGAELAVGVGRAKRSVPALKVFDDSRRDQDVDRGHERQAQRGRQDLGDVGRRPGEAGERRQSKRHCAERPLVPAEQITDGDGQPDAEQGPRASAAIAGRRRRLPQPRSKPRSRGSHRDLRSVAQRPATSCHERAGRRVCPARRAGRAACGAGGSPSSRRRRTRSPRRPHAAPWPRTGPAAARRRSS